MTTDETHVQESTVREEVREISPGIYAYLQLDGSWGLNNCGFLAGEDAVTLIDTCFTEARTRRLLTAVQSTTRKPIRTLINTHHHGDHTFGNYLVPEATVIAQTYCRAEAQRAQLSTTALFPGVQWGDVRVRLPSVTFDESLTVYVDDLRLELLYTGPAHTKGDSVIWIPERRILFAGDVTFKECTPFVLEGAVERYFDALARLRELEPAVVVPGHGPICGPEVFDEVEAYLRFVRAVAQEAYAAQLSPLEAARQTDLGSFAGWHDQERLVANIARVYSELRGEPPAQPLNLLEVAAQMIEYNGGKPLRCLA